MRFDSLGNAQETHKEYSAAVLEVGSTMNTAVIDLGAMSRLLLQKLGPDQSKFLFIFLNTLQNPHYPNGRQDRTHFNEYGARRMTEIVLAEIKRRQLPLAARIRTKSAP